jgi:hypothetical protein
VWALQTSHSPLKLSYWSSPTSSHHVTMEEISERPEDHCFNLHMERTSNRFSLSLALSKQVPIRKLNYTDLIRKRIFWCSIGHFPVPPMFWMEFSQYNYSGENYEERESRKEWEAVGNKGESKQHQIQICLCALELQEWDTNITPFGHSVRALILTQKSFS